jgi:RNA polymerase sigma factor (sigma-70 family)
MTSAETEQIHKALSALGVDRQDDEAWGTIINLSYPIALAIANRILHGALDLAKDAVWEAFARIARYADFQLLALIAPEAFLRYLKQVTRRACYDLLKSLARRAPEIQSGLDISELGIQSGAPTPEETLAAEELYSEITSILGPDEQGLLTLMLEGLTLDEIGERLKISYSTAGVRLHRLREKIRNYLKNRGL